VVHSFGLATVGLGNLGPLGGFTESVLGACRVGSAGHCRSAVAARSVDNSVGCEVRGWIVIAPS